jgi:two-component system, NarL family, nitrate/nitrite response regulator NarL
MEKIKVLIADDHQIIIDGLKLILDQEADIETVGVALDGEEVITQVRALEELDIAIIDINMPKKDGIEVTRELKALYPEIKVLVSSMYNKKEFIRNLMDAGIDGYILKNSGRAELLTAIRSLAKGEPYYAGAVTKTITKSYQKSRIFDTPGDIDLSDREKNIIKLIAEEHSTAEIADKLFISPHTVSTHRKNILSKLAVKNTAGIMKYAIQTGIVKGFDL